MNGGRRSLSQSDMFNGLGSGPAACRNPGMILPPSAHHTQYKDCCTPHGARICFKVLPPPSPPLSLLSLHPHPPRPPVFFNLPPLLAITHCRSLSLSRSLSRSLSLSLSHTHTHTRSPSLPCSLQGRERGWGGGGKEVGAGGGESKFEKE